MLSKTASAAITVAIITGLAGLIVRILWAIAVPAFVIGVIALH